MRLKLKEVVTVQARFYEIEDAVMTPLPKEESKVARKIQTATTTVNIIRPIKVKKVQKVDKLKDVSEQALLNPLASKDAKADIITQELKVRKIRLL